METSYNVAKLKAQHDLPYIEEEVRRFESVVVKLLSSEKDDIFSRHRGFLYSNSIR